jgi:hypothetical protein
MKPKSPLSPDTLSRTNSMVSEFIDMIRANVSTINLLNTSVFEFRITLAASSGEVTT